MRLFFITLFLGVAIGGSANGYDTKDMEKYYSEDSYPTAAQCAGCHQQITMNGLHLTTLMLRYRRCSINLSRQSMICRLEQSVLFASAAINR